MGLFSAIGKAFKFVGEAVVGAVKDVVTAPFKIIKEQFDMITHLVQGDFKAMFKDMTQMIGPALTVVSTVATFGAAGIAINTGKQIAINVLKKVAINAGGEILGGILGKAGVKGPVAGALVSTAQSFASGGFKMDVETMGKTAGKAALSGAAQTDGTLGDVAKVANVAVSAVDASKGGIKDMDAKDIGNLAIDVAGTGVLGKDVAKGAAVADAAMAGIYGATEDGKFSGRDALDVSTKLAASGVLGSDVQKAATAADVAIHGVRDAKKADGKVSGRDALDIGLDVLGSGAAGEKAKGYAALTNSVRDGVTTAKADDGKVSGREIAAMGLAATQSGVLGEDVQKYGAMAGAITTGVRDVRNGANPLDELVDLADSGAFGSDATAMASVFCALSDSVKDVRDGEKVTDEMLALSAQGVFGAKAQQIAELVSSSRREGGGIKSSALLNNVLLAGAHGNYGDNATLLSTLLLSAGVSFGHNDNRHPASAGISIAA